MTFQQREHSIVNLPVSTANTIVLRVGTNIDLIAKHAATLESLHVGLKQNRQSIALVHIVVGAGGLPHIHGAY